MNDLLLVICNTPDKESAHKLARLLLAEKLCACVNILPQIESLYTWEGKLEQANEVTMLIKTTKACYQQLQNTVKTNHPYEIPEIIAVDIADGSPEYLNWIVNSTTIKCTLSE